MTILTLAPLPYQPASDNVVTLLLLACFLLSAYILSGSRGLLLQLGKEFMLHRERVSIFSDSTASEMRYFTLLFVQTGVLAGLCLFCYFAQTTPGLTTHLPSPVLLGVYVLASMLFLLLRWVVYSVLGWIFFDEHKTVQWLSAYSTLVYHTGLPLFFLMLAAVYVPISTTAIAISGILVAILAEMLIFYKWLKLFCNNLRGCLLLILYFCALEAIPYLLMYRFLLQLNEYITIKF